MEVAKAPHLFRHFFWQEDRAAYSKKLRGLEETIDECEKEKQEAVDRSQSLHEVYEEVIYLFLAMDLSTGDDNAFFFIPYTPF
jgi:hypothetical protein